jgi:hypothetical protein
VSFTVTAICLCVFWNRLAASERGRNAATKKAVILSLSKNLKYHVWHLTWRAREAAAICFKDALGCIHL